MKKNFYWLFLGLIITTSLSAQTNGIYNILDYGAVSGSKMVNHQAIQKAIDECSKNGGGQVLVSSTDSLAQSSGIRYVYTPC